jgi:glucokinase
VLTLGTGVGGGLVLDDRLYRGWAEVGHVVVQVGGPPCQGNCHGRGHLEALASGTAADAVARDLYGPDADARQLVERGRAGDGEARARLAEIGGHLGAAIGSIANLIDPDLVVVGGGFGEAAGELVLGPAQEAARREALAPADSTLRVVPAELGSDAGLVGAGLVAFEALDGMR